MDYPLSKVRLKNLLALTLFICLLLWGPINSSVKGWIYIRIAYLILAPLLLWLIIDLIWKIFHLSEQVEKRLLRISFLLISITLLIFAITEKNKNYHLENTETVRTADGYEDVGDYVPVSGPDWSRVILLGGLSIGVLWFGVLRKEKE